MASLIYSVKINSECLIWGFKRLRTNCFAFIYLFIYLCPSDFLYASSFSGDAKEKAILTQSFNSSCQKQVFLWKNGNIAFISIQIDLYIANTIFFFLHPVFYCNLQLQLMADNNIIDANWILFSSLITDICI